MAELKSLSPKLEEFKNFCDGELNSVKGTQSSVSSSLSSAANKLGEAISLFNKASSDSKIASLNGGISLAKDGLDRVKSHVEGDIDALLGDCKGLRSGPIQQILDKIEEGKAWKEASTEKDKDGKLVTKQNDQAKINEANAFIDRMNSKGEAQLDAIAAAINGVSFGVKGNMTLGGSLGASVSYADGYHFNGDQWDKDNPETKYEDTPEITEEVKTVEKEQEDLTFIEGVGAVGGGVVSGVAKLAEGVLDFGTMLVGGVVSIFNRDTADNIYAFAERDLTEEVQRGILGDKIVDSGLYKGTQEVSKFVTYQAARCIAPPVGAMVAQCGMSGNAMENIYHSTHRADLSIGAGLVLEEIQGRLNANTSSSLAVNFAKEMGAYAAPEVVTVLTDTDRKSNNTGNGNNNDNENNSKPVPATNILGFTMPDIDEKPAWEK